MPDFSTRSTEAELMDDLQATGQVVVQTLKELHTINRWLGGNKVSTSGLKKLLDKKGSEANQPITIADLGCGGGDMLKLMALWGRKHSFKLSLVGIDANQAILDYAALNTCDFPEITYRRADILSPAFDESAFDIIHTSLFTHHFTSAELAGLMSRWKQQARLGIVNNDLHRHWFAFHSIDWLTRLFSRSAMVKNDARLSVLRSFRRSDWESILQKAEITRYSLTWRWAFRWELVVYN